MGDEALGVSDESSDASQGFEGFSDGVWGCRLADGNMGDTQGKGFGVAEIPM